MNSEMLIFLGMAAAMLIVCIVLVVFVLRALKNPRVASSVDASRAREDELRSQLEDARNKTRELEAQVTEARYGYEKALEDNENNKKQLEFKLAMAVRDAENQKDEEIRAAKAEKEQIVQELEATKKRAEADLRTAAERSKLELEASQSNADTRLQAEVAKAAANLEALKSEMSAQAVEERRKIERERDDAVATQREQKLEFDKQVGEQQAKIEGMENEYKVKLDELEKSKDLQIDDLKKRLETARDMKSKLSVKLLGESLEQHCEMEFNQIRSTAFRNAEFGKDNEAIEGTKGDYIYREHDDDGIEIISIMFEMKTESEDSVNTRTNESHLKKLDKDRTNKKCEYAVLVSMLEPDSDYYNAGIVDVSHLYPKMYVIRPQFFIPLISLLRNAALSSLETRRELNVMLQSQPDVTGFEEKLAKLKGEVVKNNNKAQGKCDSALKEIDNMISKLNKIRNDIEMIQRYSSRANQKMEDITIRKLTYGNEGMKTKFDEARKIAPISAEVVSVESVDEQKKNSDASSEE